MNLSGLHKDLDKDKFYLPISDTFRATEDLESQRLLATRN